MNQKTLYKLSGILSILAGILYILIQIIHPDETLEMDNSQQFFIVGVLTMIMAIFSIIGLLGAYLLQVKETKLLGHIGLILFSTFWLITFAFSFFESFTLPLLFLFL